MSVSAKYKGSLEDLANNIKQCKPPLIRTLYFTSQPIGKSGTSGQLRQGDLVQDPYSKLVYYDPETKLYNVQRKETPMEKVPLIDIVGIMRSFLRQAPIQGAVVTLAETDPTTGNEKIVRVLRTYEIDPCAPTTLAAQQGTSPSSSSSWFGVTAVLLVVAVAIGVYFSFFRKGNKPL